MECVCQSKLESNANVVGFMIGWSPLMLQMICWIFVSRTGRIERSLVVVVQVSFCLGLGRSRNEGNSVVIC